MQRQHILGLEIDITNIQQASENLLTMAQTKTGAYICFANAHMCVEAQENHELRRAVRDRDRQHRRAREERPRAA